MAIGYQKTREERTFYQLVDEEWESLSEAARTVVRQAMGVAYKEYLIDSRIYMTQEYQDDIKAMRRTAAELIEHEDLAFSLSCRRLRRSLRLRDASRVARVPSGSPWILQNVLKIGGGCRVGETVGRVPEEGALRTGTGRYPRSLILAPTSPSRGRAGV